MRGILSGSKDMLPSNEDKFIVRRVIDILLGRPPVSKDTKLFTTRRAAIEARAMDIARATKCLRITTIRKIDRLWGYDKR